MSTQQTMPVWLKKRAYSTPERFAVMTSTDKMTFAELHSWSSEIAQKLLSLGIKENDYIGILSNNSLEVVAIFHALQYIGAIMVPLNTRLTPSELVWQTKDCHAIWLIYDGTYGSTAEKISSETTHLQLLRIQDVDQIQIVRHHTLKQEVHLEKVQTIIYTSGTTGFPKGVQLSYGNHWWSAISSVLNLGLSHKDIWLASVPLFHVSGLSILVKSVIYGMPIHLHDKFDAKVINHAIKYEGVTMISVVSTMLKQLLIDLGDTKYPSTFRCMLLGGGPAPKVFLDSCKDKDIPVFQTYGMTETSSQIVTLSPEDMLSKLGSAGKPLFPSQIKIIENHEELAAEQPGEIVVAGPNVTEGYLNNEQATNEAFQDGWLHTGDIGYLDHDGFLYVLDRRKDLIISGGENVYPAEIESLLLMHQSIDDVGVIGVPDEQWGQVPVAFVKVKPTYNLKPEELKRYCQSLLATYKIPKYFYEIDELPRNASRKLLRRHLTKYLPEGLRKSQ